MPYEGDVFDDHLPKLKNQARRSYELKLLEDPEFDVSAAHVKHRTPRNDDHKKLHMATRRKLSLSTDSSVSSASSRSNTVTIDDYDSLKVGRPSNSYGLNDYATQQDKNLRKRKQAPVERSVVCRRDSPFVSSSSSLAGEKEGRESDYAEFKDYVLAQSQTCEMEISQDKTTYIFFREEFLNKMTVSSESDRPTLDFGDIVKSLGSSDELGISSDINLSEKEIVAVYKDKVTRLTQERDSLNSQVSHYRKTAESAQSELAAEKVKASALQEDLARTKQKIKDLQQEQFDLQCDVENYKQNLARQNALVNSLQQRVRDAEDRSEVKENSLSRNEMAIISLKKELQSQVDKRQQLEVAMKHHASSAEEHSRKSESWERKFRELSVQLCSILTVDSGQSSAPVADLIISKTAEIVREHGTMHKKLEKLMNNVQNSELEAKASRETIMRLVTDVSKEQKAFSETRLEVDSLRREVDLSRLCLGEKEAEIRKLRDQLSQSQKVWSETRMELEEKISEIDKLDHDMKAHESEGKKAHTKLLHFRRNLANLLSDDMNAVPDDEEMILQHVREMQIANRKLAAIEEKLSSKLMNLNEEMKNRKSLQRTILQRANQAESEFQTLDERIKALEGELLAADVDRDHLKDERRKYMAFLDKLARAMKLDEIAIDAGFELTAEAVLTRGEQLAKKETESIQDRTTAIYALQRKVKTLNEKLESKELHLNVSKKKCQELEDLLKDKVRIENEKGNASVEYKKLKKKYERLQADFATSQDTIVHLKAELSDAGNLKVENIEQKRAIEELEATLNKLAKSKYSTSQQLKGVKDRMRNSSKESKEELDRRSELVENLSKELRSAKDALREVLGREKQLLEFRRLLANLLGLDADKLSVPDYEIMTRVESLVKEHQTYSATTKTLEHTLNDLDRGFRSTFNDAVTILKSPRQGTRLKT